jgi:hypothetical protein
MKTFYYSIIRGPVHQEVGQQRMADAPRLVGRADEGDRLRIEKRIKLGQTLFPVLAEGLEDVFEKNGFGNGPIRELTSSRSWRVSLQNRHSSAG